MRFTLAFFFTKSTMEKTLLGPTVKALLRCFRLFDNNSTEKCSYLCNNGNQVAYITALEGRRLFSLWSRSYLLLWIKMARFYLSIHLLQFMLNAEQ